MGTPNIPNFSNKNKSLHQRIEKYVALINNVYEKISDDALNLASLCNPADDKDFSFADYPFTKDAIKQLQQNLHNGIYSIILSSTSEEWKNSNLVQDLVARKVLKEYVGTTKTGEQYSRYFQTNPDSLKAFQSRRVGKMNLSSNVWELTEQHISELEDSISLAIADGTSAMSLAASVKQYLKDPSKRFRRRKEILADGSTKWHLSKNAKQYHPGAGRYRSSARNAQRLARTEINMAYRTAEQTRWEQFDFVVGYEVKTTYSEKHIIDICDQLAGKYPKSFHFVGWHPNCMCYCIPILKTEDEFWADDSEDSTKSVNEVTRVPEKFNEWIRDNKERIETAENNGKLPYFIRDNKDEVEKILNPEEFYGRKINSLWDAISNGFLPSECSSKIQEIKDDITFDDFDVAERKIKTLQTAAVRHANRTDTDRQKIQDTWDKHRLDGVSDIIPDAEKWFYDKHFTIQDLQTTKRNVLHTINVRIDKSSLEKFKDGLLYEANYVLNNTSYSTKQIAYEAYLKQIQIVEDKIFWRDKKIQTDDIISKLSAVNPKLAKKFEKNIQDAIDSGAKDSAHFYNLGKWEKIIDLRTQLEADGVDISDFEKLIKDGKLNKAWKEYTRLSTATEEDLEEYCKKHYTTEFTVHDQASFDETMKHLINDEKDIWKNAPIEQREALHKYTGIESTHMNHDRGMGIANDMVTEADKILDKVKLSKDIVLRSGQSNEIAKFIFGDDFYNLLCANDVDSLNSKYDGLKGINKAYMSTSYNENGGFQNSFEFHIFAPKGTNAILVHPFSAHGERRGVNWDGETYSKYYDEYGETEILLHGDLIYKFIKAEKGTGLGGSIRLYIQIIGRKTK